MSAPDLQQLAVDRRLVARIVQGDERAFHELFDLYSDRLFRVALGRVGFDRDLAAELTHSTLCRAIENLDGFRGESSLYTWLYACCRQQIRDHFRRAKRLGERELVDEELEAKSADFEPPEEDLDRRRRRLQVHEALDLLPDHQSEILRRRFFEHHTVRHIGDALGITEKAAESRLARAKQAMKRILDQLGAAAGVAETTSTSNSTWGVSR